MQDVIVPLLCVLASAAIGFALGLVRSRRRSAGRARSPRGGERRGAVDEWRDLIEGLPIGIAVLDRGAAIVCVNSSLADIAGYEKPELEGLPIETLVPERSRERHGPLCASYRADFAQRPMRAGAELPLRRKDGGERPVSVWIGGFGAGDARHFVVAVSDLSAAHEAERSRAERSQMLQAMNEILEERLADQSRELDAARLRLLDEGRIRQDLEMAVEVQRSLLPRELPRMEGYCFSAIAFPSRVVDGDLYDLVLDGEGACAMMLADISGKGLPAAMFSFAALALYRRLIREGERPGAALTKLNAELYADLDRAERFVTMIAARLDAETGALDVANAGGCRVIIFDGGGGGCRALPSSGLPLGIFPDSAAGEERILLRPGMGALLYSDGITESANARGELYGDERLLELVARKARQDADALAASIVVSVGEFREGVPLQDDLTLIVAKAGPRKLRVAGTCDLEAASSVPIRLRDAALAYGPEFARDLELASSELLANVLKHGYEGKGGPMELELSLLEDGVELELRERGKSFHPESLVPPSLDGIPTEGGYGLYIVRSTMDDFRYEGGVDGNVWTLVKRR